MRRSYAALELHIPFWAGNLKQSRAVGLCGSENRANRSSNRNTAIWNLFRTQQAEAWTPDLGLGSGATSTFLGPSVPNAVREVASRFFGLASEYLVAFLFDKNGVLLQELRVTSGSDCQIHATFRPLVSAALAINAHQILLAHNHPSGCSSPSSADIQFTRDLVSICTPLEITLVDHLIVSNARVSSMRKANLL